MRSIHFARSSLHLWCGFQHRLSFVSPGTQKRLSHSIPTPNSPPRTSHLVHAKEDIENKDDDSEVVYNTEFGYSRKDVLIIGVLTIGLGYGLYYGLQSFAGLDEFQAGSTAQLIVFLGVLFTWVLTYLFRVGSKKMTYVTQLKEYEEAVMQKRLDEMTESELETLMEEVEKEKEEARKKGLIK
eukprot:g7211.t1